MSFDCSIFLAQPLSCSTQTPCTGSSPNIESAHASHPFFVLCSFSSRLFTHLLSPYPTCETCSPIAILSGISAPTKALPSGHGRPVWSKTSGSRHSCTFRSVQGRTTPIHISAANVVVRRIATQSSTLLSCFQIAALEATSRRLLQSLQRPFVGGEDSRFLAIFIARSYGQLVSTRSDVGTATA